MLGESRLRGRPYESALVGFNLGQAGANLNQIAKAGGTNKAFLIDKGDIGAAFVNAMLSIATQPLNCALEIPNDQKRRRALPQQSR